eukprot:scaffold207776_cov32-Tisochrysis_lutea.AAC.5
MQLGAKKGDDSLLQAMAKEGDIAPDIPPGGLGPPGAPAAMAAAAVAGLLTPSVPDAHLASSPSH